MASDAEKRPAFSPDSVTQPCDLGCVTQPLSIAVFSFTKWG